MSSGLCQARACSILATNTLLTFGECAHDLLVLSLRVLVNDTLPIIERMQGFFHKYKTKFVLSTVTSTLSTFNTCF